MQLAITYALTKCKTPVLFVEISYLEKCKKNDHTKNTITVEK